MERTRDIALANIQRVARNYFRPHDLVIVVVGDRAAVASQLASIGQLTD